MQDRRAFLSVSGSALAAFWLSANPEDVRAALAYARRSVERKPSAWQFLTDEQAADIEAMTSHIIPSEPGSPGAREAGVVYFVDQSLATWAKDHQEDFTKGLAAMNAEVTTRWTGTARVAQLPPEQQVELLRAQEDTPFFSGLLEATMMGVFGNPSYGGNRNKVGWQILGFEDRFAWQPPFGDYDKPAAQGGR